MKVIDLLNKIANNEEVPKKIFYPGVYRCVLVYDEKQKDYSVLGEYYMFKDLYSYQKTQDFINDEIMVIEDEKIEKLDMKEMKEDSYSTQNEIMLGYKINEIIDFIKGNSNE